MSYCAWSRRRDFLLNVGQYILRASLDPIGPMPELLRQQSSTASVPSVFREQLKGPPIKVIEVFPPAVQSQPSLLERCKRVTDQSLVELHDEKHQPDIKNGRAIGMPLDQFTREAFAGLEQCEEQVAVGLSKGWFDALEPLRQAKFRQLIEMMRP